MTEVIRIDTRELPAPEPMEKVLNRLGEIQEGSYLEMHHRMRPEMLLNILRNNGFDYRVREKHDEVFVYIFRSDDGTAREAIKDL